MNRNAAALVMLIAACTVQAAPAPEDKLKPAVPATSIERPENNPAKAAAAAKEAFRKDEAAAEAPGADVLSPEDERLVHGIEQALRKDSRTASLGIMVSVDDNGTIDLHGAVPTTQSRSAAEGVAAKAASGHRIHNQLVVIDK